MSRNSNRNNNGESSNESSQGSNDVIGNGPHREPWEFKISMTRNEVDAHFITIPERVLDETLFLTNLSQVDVQRLHINKMVCVTLRSLDRLEFYDMNLKTAPSDPCSLVLVPWFDPIADKFVGVKFFQDFWVESCARLGFYWSGGILCYKVLNWGMKLFIHISVFLFIYVYILLFE